MPVHTVKPGETLSAIAKQYGLPSWRELYNDPANAAFRTKRPNPNLIHPGDKINIPGKDPKLKTVLVAVHGWQGKKPTQGFKLCAQTVSLNSSLPNKLVRHTVTKKDFLDLCKELSSTYQIAEFHAYSHFGMDGPIFSDGQFMIDEMNKSVLPAMNWAAKARAYFYGCNAGLSPWIVAFVGGQKATALGSAGYSLFSKRPKKFYPFDGDPNSIPCYLDCFPGMNELLIKKYGYKPANSVLEEIWRKATLFPEWREAREKHLPPKKMIQFDPS